MSKTKNKIRISFPGGSSDSVTGSLTHIQMSEYNILLECGLFQSNNILEDYRINTRKLPFKPKEIDYIFINHSHADHALLLGRLYANGCTARIIMPTGNKELYTIMAADSAYIMGKDVETLQRKHNITVQPVYTQADVNMSVQYIDEYDFGEVIELNENISFQLIPSGHIVNSAQIILWLKEGNHTSKILYTSDLGNSEIPKFYSSKFEPVNSANIVIGESTYASETRSVSLKDRAKDLEKIKSVIESVCVEDRHKVLIPVFSLDRCQNLLTHLYNLFGKDESFDIPILIDSPLAIRISELYESILTGDDLSLYREVTHWQNIKWLNEFGDSQEWQHSKSPCVVLSASGFMQSGRSRQWAKTLLPDSKSHILFVGYSSENSMASKIKYGKNQKTITIDGKVFANRCNVTDLKSFSSHMSHDQLKKYYSDINADKIALVHGNFKDKLEFTKELQDEISRKNKSGRVICVNKTTEILL